MTRRKERFIETFVTLMFPVALLVACTTDTPDEHLAPNTTEYNTRFEPKNSIARLGTHDATLKMINQQQSNATVTDTEEKSEYRQVSQKVQLQAPAKSVFLFAKNKTALDLQDLVFLKQHAEFLIQHPQFTLTISGHSDRSGSASYNQKLSEQRAKIVANILVKDGVPKSQLITEGLGDKIPFAKDGRMKENRRVELQYSPQLLKNNELNNS